MASRCRKLRANLSRDQIKMISILRFRRSLRSEFNAGTILLGSTLASVSVHDRFPTAPLTIFLQFRFLQSGFLLCRGDPNINCGPLHVTHGFLPVRRFFRFFAFAHRAFAAFRAISRCSFADNFFSLALTDLRPSAEKYSDNFLSITGLLYHSQRLSIEALCPAESLQLEIVVAGEIGRASCR